MTKRQLAVILLFTAIVYPLAAQTFPFYGQVIDEEGLTLSGARITMRGGGKTFTAYSGTDGKFVIDNLPNHSYELTAELAGFARFDRSKIVKGENNFVVIMKRLSGSQTIVVSASKSETDLLHSPASVTEVDENTIRVSPAQNYGDLLRSVPGLNISQTTNRGFSMTSRIGTEVAAGSELVLLDGRTVYLDFGGFVLWDFLPVQLNDIERVEVIHGPASAVWGANAQTGVINILTKSPRNSEGMEAVLSAGIFQKSENNNGTQAGVQTRFAQVINDRWAYKLSGGFFHSEPFSRPSGVIPRSHVPGTSIATGGTPYALVDYANADTNQPKLDGRVDQQLENGDHLTYTAGIAGTDGTIIARTGPFRIEDGSLLGYGKVDYSHGQLKLSVFTNVLDGKATNVLGATGVDGKPITFVFKTNTYDFEASDSFLLAPRHFLTLGGNLRHNDFNVSLAPGADDRNEAGAFLQDEIAWNNFRFVAGGRVDHFSSIDHSVFSPRLAVIYSFLPQHSIRFSYNRAYRIPSVQDNHYDLTLLNSVRLPSAGTFVFPTEIEGNPGLTEATLDAWEAGYIGSAGKDTKLSASAYIYRGKDTVALRPVTFYNASMPPPNWPLDPAFVPPNTLPERFSFRNLPELIENKGLEVAVEHRFGNRIDSFVNYSFQTDPKILNAPVNTVPTSNFPPHHRLNAGVQYNANMFFGGVSLNYQSTAFWLDVLDSRFWGPTSPFTSMNLSFGLRWPSDEIYPVIRINNLFDKKIQQHVFGDIIRRSVSAELHLKF